MKLGFIVNPCAGIGGSLAFKGSDGNDVRERALQAGAEKKALFRAETFLRLLLPRQNEIKFYTYGGEMGELSLRALGFAFDILGRPEHVESTSLDTLRAVSLLKETEVDCVIFLGGDGTARDVCSVLSDSIPVVGVPSGVKMHSAVYAKTPTDAANLILSLVSFFPRCGRGNGAHFKLGEVMDVDEDEFRGGRLSARLYGYMRIPASRYMQGKKSTGSNEHEALSGAARSIAREMEAGIFYLVGPGTSTRYVFDLLDLEKTLLGVDVLFEGKLVKADAAYGDLLNLLEGKRYRIVVTTIGGQGCLFGRGNQQIGPALLKGISKNDVIIMASLEKLLSIQEGTLYNDTGDPELDRFLSGYYRIRTGDGADTVFPCR
ncbi:MAG: ATP-NAD kinase family protein [Synergistaceae bacterium]|jgi:predicted polyphosphate/ATP-dependent NAD kinase|nr:ATP-NAD kinase family protein [Synergistaceae bacterium]